MNKEELIIGFFEKGYCCNLDEVKNTCLGLLKENQELKKHLKIPENCNLKTLEDYKSYYEDTTDESQEIIVDYIKENKQLKDNWNELKKYIKTEIPEDVFVNTEWFVSILDKMQELERK